MLLQPRRGVTIAKSSPVTKFDLTVEVVSAGVDPRKQDHGPRHGQLPKGPARLPVLVCHRRPAEEVAAVPTRWLDDMIERIQGGFLTSTRSSPPRHGKVGCLAGCSARGLMPNPKTGTADARRRQGRDRNKGGKIEFRTDRHGNLHFIIGKASFPRPPCGELRRRPGRGSGSSPPRPRAGT
jgi:large subunit ribosomal protein L1